MTTFLLTMLCNLPYYLMNKVTVNLKKGEICISFLT